MEKGLENQASNSEMDNQNNDAAESLIEHTDLEDKSKQKTKEKGPIELSENTLPYEMDKNTSQIETDNKCVENDNSMDNADPVKKDNRKNDELTTEDNLQDLTDKTETVDDGQKRKKIIVFVLFGIIGIVMLIFFIFNQIQTSKINKALEIGEINIEEEKYEEAILSFDEVLSIDEKIIAAYEGKAETYIGMEDYTNAEGQLEKARIIEYTNNGKTLMAMVYLNTDRKDEGFKLVEQVVAENPKDTKVIIRLIDFYSQINNYAKAIEFLEKQLVITADQEDLKKIYDKLILTYSKAGKTEDEIMNLLKQAEKATGDGTYLTKSEEYIVESPTFSLAAGEYSGSQSLELISSQQGDKLYYTIDGSIPTSNSMEYTSAITLDEGEIIVKVIEVNHSGFTSLPIEMNYVITKAALTEHEFMDRIYGIWYTAGILVKISDSTLTVSPRHSGGATFGEYTVENISENGGMIAVDEVNVDEGDRNNPEKHTGIKMVEFDFGETNDGKMKIKYHVLNRGEWYDLDCGVPQGNSEWRIPDSNPDGYMTYKLN